MKVGIAGTGSYLPSKILTNRDLATRLNVSEEWILEKTAIRQRRIAGPEEAASDLAIEASRRALKSSGLEPGQLDLIVLSTSSGDQPSPATACRVQSVLDAPDSIPMDVSAGCSGFLYALRIGHDMLKASKEMNHALIIGTEVPSRFVDYDDKRTSVLFGDGSGAVVISKVSPGQIVSSTLGADAREIAELAGIPGGGSRMPTSAETLANRLHYLKMDGRKVREFISAKIHEIFLDALASSNFSVSDLDLLIPHPPNGRMVDEWVSVLKLDKGQLFSSVEDVGNTSSASIPIALDQAVRDARVERGDVILLLAFGGGGTWGTTLLQW